MIGLLGAVSVLGAGCSTGDLPPSEAVNQREDSIFYGTVDTSHQAVVGVISESGQGVGVCTGTIIGVSGNKGYVLTAAHCVAGGKPDYILLGNDLQSQSTQGFQVTGYKAHPSYKGKDYDFAMVTFTGASASTPVIAAMTK